MSTSTSTSFSVVRDTGRFGDVFFNVVDGDGWTVACYLESENGKALADYHAQTGKHPKGDISISREVLGLFAR